MTGWLRTRGTRLALCAVLGTVLVSAGAYAASPRPIKVSRCGYVRAQYGRSAVYPWHLSCAAARRVVVASASRHARTIAFGPGWDGGAVRIDRRWWVCTGQMGFYDCGYPYRAVTVHGARGYRGPFTRNVAFETCSAVGPAGCTRTSEFTQPER